MQRGETCWNTHARSESIFNERLGWWACASVGLCSKCLFFSFLCCCCCFPPEWGVVHPNADISPNYCRHSPLCGCKLWRHCLVHGLKFDGWKHFHSTEPKKNKQRNKICPNCFLVALTPNDKYRNMRLFQWSLCSVLASPVGFQSNDQNPKDSRELENTPAWATTEFWLIVWVKLTL